MEKSGFTLAAVLGVAAATTVALYFLRTDESLGVEDRREGLGLLALFAGYVTLKLTVFS